MDEQTKFAFMNEGGMMDDGRKVDPVSGNEVPPGSTAKEVRDDIDIKISEGEFVIPADVTQFYGVKKLEDMIKKAKEELSEMEQEGRMGGDPDDDLPLSDEELETVSEENEALAFAEGGVVPQFNLNQYTYGGPSTETRLYTNQAGEKRPILFVNGQPQSPVPEGFVPDTPEGRKTFNADTPTDTKSDLSAAVEPKEKFDGDGIDPEKAKDVAEWGADDFESWGSTLGFGEKVSKGVAGLGGALAGGVLGGPFGSIAGRTAAQSYMESLVEKDAQAKLEEITRRATDPNLAEEERARYQGLAERFKSGLGGDSEKGILGNFLGNLIEGFKSPSPTRQKPAPAPAPTKSSGHSANNSFDNTKVSKSNDSSIGAGSNSSGSTGAGGYSERASDERAKGGLIKRHYKRGGLVKKVR
jgi:hypothetical protein